MPRPRRIDNKGRWHHVMNRGAGRRVTFRDDRERRWFVESLSEIDGRFEVEVHAFCLMGNHYHLLLRSREARLSDAMQWVSSGFTRRANAARGVDGSLFRGRFHSVPVEREAHLIHLFRYVNANPRHIGWSAPLKEYPWSGMRAAGRIADESVATDLAWLYVDVLASFFPSEAAFERFVERSHATAPKTQRFDGLSLGIIEEAVAIASGLSDREHTKSNGRSVAMLLAVESAGLRAEDVAKDWGTSVAGAQFFLSRSRGRRAREPEVAELHHLAQELLSDPRCASGSDTVAQSLEG